MATLLLTGANGHIGFQILLDALSSGYKVRASVRNAQRSNELLSHPLIRDILSARGPDVLEIIHVPDILAPDAWDSALARSPQLTHIIHTATPVPFATPDPRRDIIEPSVQGTENLLRATARAVTSGGALIRRVVLTSSGVANYAVPPNPSTHTTPASRVPNPSEQDLSAPDLDILTAYRYSKVMALNFGDAFLQGSGGTKPQFDIVNVFPGFVNGPNRFARDREGLVASSNGPLLAQLTGEVFADPKFGEVAHVEDVSAVHLAALDEKKVPFRSGKDLAVLTPVGWDDAWSVVQRRFPDEVRKGVFRKGEQPTIKTNWDPADTEERCGLKFRSFERTVVDLVEQYLSLA